MLLGITDNVLLVIVIVLCALVVSIVIHELMHGLIGLWLGDTTAKEAGRLTLNPLSHIDIFTTILLPIILVIAGLPPFGAAKPVPLNPAKLKYEEFGMAIVAVAGPLTNLLLALVGGVMLYFSGTVNHDIWVSWWWYFTTINTSFFIFNMIPFPPLDGSRVLFAFAPRPLQRLMMQIESLGFMAIVIFMVVIFPLISPYMRELNTELIRIVSFGSIG